MRFDELDLEDAVLDGLYDMNFEETTPIQEKTIPLILEGKDIIGCAQTGTGKTAAYVLPVISELSRGDFPTDAVNAVIMAPTRELAQQIDQQIQGFTYYIPSISAVAVYGGTDGITWEQQRRGLELGADIVIATPGRLLSHIKLGTVDLSRVSFFILDEADRMLDMGFFDDIMQVYKQLPPTCQTIMFSATMPREVERIAKTYLRHPQEISTGKKNQGADTVMHEYYQVRAKDCYETLRRVIDCAPDMYAIIFTRTKVDARDIARKLHKDGIDCDALHGDLSQAQRDDVMERFRSKRLKVLVATDVAARGLDVDNLTHVINYNLPEDIESYTHRSGRTGRAGREGISVAIINSKEKGKLRRIEKTIKKEFQYREVPGGEEVCRAQLLWYADKVLAAEPKETLVKYQNELYEKFEHLTKEELLQKILSYEFGKLLKKYADVEDLNLPENERGDKKRDIKAKKESKAEEISAQFTTFTVNVGREDGFTPRDLLTIINENVPRKGLEIGSIRVFETNTKFEIDLGGLQRFASFFRNVSFNGLPFIPAEVKDRYGRGKDRERESFGRRRDSEPRWRSDKKRADKGKRGRFSEKKKGMGKAPRARKKR